MPDQSHQASYKCDHFLSNCSDDRLLYPSPTQTNIWPQTTPLDFGGTEISIHLVSRSGPMSVQPLLKFGSARAIKLNLFLARRHQLGS